ncbi:MAG: DUF4199 domain-containing protein [Bacteroidota bacterium]
MKKIVITFGAVIGLIISTNAVIHMNMMYSNPDYKGNDVTGYATIVIIFSIIYFGVRNYRNKYLDGKIGFAEALKVGALICFFASTIYVVIGLSYYYWFAPDFIDVYADYVLRNSAPSELEAKTAQMDNFREMYKNPLFAILITYIEVLPIGIIVAFISAFILKKK